ncbi:hypothetical protein HY745_06425 [Candidatus Desantisbacteria bacterium]|nr:hypothetical protein [Candidatus Desantisbacteria bacterium]
MPGKIGSIFTFLLLVFIFFITLTGTLGKLLYPTVEKILGKPAEEVIPQINVKYIQDYQDIAKNLEQKKRELELREAFMESNIERIEQRIKDLNDEQQKLISQAEVLGKFAREKNEQAEKNLDNVTKLYAKMPAENVASILSKMDSKLAIKIFRRIKPAKAALILGALQKDEAVKFSSKLADTY